MPRFCSNSHQLRVPVLLGPMKKTLCASEVVAAMTSAVSAVLASVHKVAGSIDKEQLHNFDKDQLY